MPSAEMDFVTLPEQKVFCTLRAAITRNRLPAGTLLCARHVAEEQGTEVEVVTRALLLLAQDAIVRCGGPGRAVVLPISESRLRDACFLREQAEVEIVRRAAAYADSDFLEELREQILRQKLVGVRSPLDLLRLDIRFHRSLAARAGLDTLWPQIESWKLWTDRVRFTVEASLSPEAMISQHSAIVDRIAVGDGDGAAAVARYHISGVLRQLPEHRLSHPEQFSD